MYFNSVNFNCSEIAMEIGGIPDQILKASQEKILQYLREKYGRSFDPSEVIVGRFRHVQWNDASLGCPKEGEFYLQQTMPGYTIQFLVNNEWVDVHTNEDGSQIVICENFIDLEMGGIPSHILKESQEKILRYLREKYGRSFDPSEVIAGRFRLVQWNDSSLGFPKEGEFYLQQETPGYEIQFYVGNGWIFVHTNADGSQIVLPDF